MEKFKIFRKLVNLRGWSFFLFKRLTWFLSVSFYIILIQESFSFDFLINFFTLLIGLALSFFWGTTLNDFYDKESDLKAGKYTGIKKFSKTEVMVILSISIIVSIFIIWKLLGNFIILHFLGILFVILYSHPKIRLKERGIWGPLANSFSELSLFLLIIAFFGYFGVDVLIFVILYWSIYFVDLVNHQIIEDYQTDKKMDIKTLAVKWGLKKTEKILRKISLIPVLLFFILSTFFVLKIKYFFVVLIFLIILYIIHPKINPKIREKYKVPLLYADFINIGLFGIIPFYFAVILFLKYPPYLPLIFLTTISNYKFILTIFRRSKKLI